jgi:hypothetical protein
MKKSVFSWATAEFRFMKIETAMLSFVVVLFGIALWFLAIGISFPGQLNSGGGETGTIYL